MHTHCSSMKTEMIFFVYSSSFSRVYPSFSALCPLRTWRAGKTFFLHVARTSIRRQFFSEPEGRISFSIEYLPLYRASHRFHFWCRQILTAVKELYFLNFLVSAGVSLSSGFFFVDTQIYSTLSGREVGLFTQRSSTMINVRQVALLMFA